ncbi:hypothetical protein MHTCC0001_19660 [Flavobacteriaceae bacterium MHTCC 0001]
MFQIKTCLIALLAFVFNTSLSNGQIPSEKTLELLSKPYSLSSAQKNELKTLITASETAFLDQKQDFIDSSITNKQLEYLKAKSQLEYLQKLASFNLQHPIFLNNDPRQKALVNTAKNINFDASKLSEIIRLYVEREHQLKEFEFTRSNAIAYANDLIDFHQYTYDSRAIHEVFSEKIAQLLSIEDYTALFESALKPIIDRASKKRLDLITKNYNVKDQNHLKSLKSITDQYAKDKIMVQHYYTYDNKELHIARVNLMIKEDEAIEKTIAGFGTKQTNTMDISFDARAPLFVKRAKEAGISDEKIKRLMYAIKDYKIKKEKYYEDFAIWQSKYLVYYYHSEATPEHYQKQLKRRIAEIMSIEEFEKMFLHQFNGRIDLKANARIGKLRMTYRKLSSSQLQKLTDMIREQVKDEFVLYEYYSYDHEDAIQKVRALKYKFDKKYKEALQEIIN